MIISRLPPIIMLKDFLWLMGFHFKEKFCNYAIVAVEIHLLQSATENRAKSMWQALERSEIALSLMFSK